MNFTTSLTKIVQFFQYSNSKTNFSKIKLISDLENWHRKLKIASFDIPQSKSLTRYQKILKDVHLDAKSIEFLPASLWNSTTVTTLLINHGLGSRFCCWVLLRTTVKRLWIQISEYQKFHYIAKILLPFSKPWALSNSTAISNASSETQI